MVSTSLTEAQAAILTRMVSGPALTHSLLGDRLWSLLEDPFTVFDDVSPRGLAWAFNGYQTIEDYNDYQLWVTVPMTVQLIPLLFIITRSSRVENFLGRFSYPIYLCHIVARDMATGVLKAPESPWTTLISMFVVAGIIVIAVKLSTERIRHAIGQRMAARTMIA